MNCPLPHLPKNIPYGNLLAPRFLCSFSILPLSYARSYEWPGATRIAKLTTSTTATTTTKSASPQVSHKTCITISYPRFRFTFFFSTTHASHSANCFAMSISASLPRPATDDRMNTNRRIIDTLFLSFPRIPGRMSSCSIGESFRKKKNHPEKGTGTFLFRSLYSLCVKWFYPEVPWGDTPICTTTINPFFRSQTLLQGISLPLFSAQRMCVQCVSKN